MYCCIIQNVSESIQRMSESKNTKIKYGKKMENTEKLYYCIIQKVLESHQRISESRTKRKRKESGKYGKKMHYTTIQKVLESLQRMTEPKQQNKKRRNGKKKNEKNVLPYYFKKYEEVRNE